MKRNIIIGLILISASVFGQSQEQKDSLITQMCKTLFDTEDKHDTIRIISAYEKHLYPFLVSYPENERSEIGSSIYYRFQKNCNEFRLILDRLDPPKGDWKTVAIKPKTNLSKKLCRKFLEHKKYAYIESSGDTVLVYIENNIYTDNFKDGTYSKLKLEWVSDCEFEIEFIESNNKLRNGFSKPGDKYRYQINGKEPNYYDMSVEVPGTDTFLTFKLYY